MSLRGVCRLLNINELLPPASSLHCRHLLLILFLVLYFWNQDKSVFKYVPLCPCELFLVCSSWANSPQTYTTTLFSQAHNGPQCSHCRVPLFSRGLLPTSSPIKWRRAGRPCSLWAAVVKLWLTLCCCPIYRVTPRTSVRKTIGWCPNCGAGMWVEAHDQARVVLCINEPGSQGETTKHPKAQWMVEKRRNCPLTPLLIQQAICHRHYRKLFYILLTFIQCFHIYEPYLTDPINQTHIWKSHCRFCPHREKIHFVIRQNYKILFKITAE